MVGSPFTIPLFGASESTCRSVRQLGEASNSAALKWVGKNGEAEVGNQKSVSFSCQDPPKLTKNVSFSSAFR